MTQGFRGKRVNWKDHPDYPCGREEACELITKLNMEGYTIKEICEKIGVSDGWVRKEMKRMDIEPYYQRGETKYKTRKKKVSDDQVRTIRATSVSVKTNRQWANELGVTRGHVDGIRNRRYRSKVK